MDLGEGFLVQDDLDGVGDVEADEFGQHSARVSEECVAEGGVSSDALSDHPLDLGSGGNSHVVLQVFGVNGNSLRSTWSLTTFWRPPCSGDEFQVGVAKGLGCGDGEVDLGEGFLMQDDVHRLGNVEANDLGQHRARISKQGVAEGGVSGDALSDDRLDLRTSGNGHGVLLMWEAWWVFGEYGGSAGPVAKRRCRAGGEPPTLLRRRVPSRRR